MAQAEAKWLASASVMTEEGVLQVSSGALLGFVTTYMVLQRYAAYRREGQSDTALGGASGPAQSPHFFNGSAEVLQLITDRFDASRYTLLKEASSARAVESPASCLLAGGLLEWRGDYQELEREVETWLTVASGRSFEGIFDREQALRSGSMAKKGIPDAWCVSAPEQAEKKVFCLGRVAALDVTQQGDDYVIHAPDPTLIFRWRFAVPIGVQFYLVVLPINVRKELSVLMRLVPARRINSESKFKAIDEKTLRTHGGKGPQGGGYSKDFLRLRVN